MCGYGREVGACEKGKARWPLGMCVARRERLGFVRIEGYFFLIKTHVLGFNLGLI